MSQQQLNAGLDRLLTGPVVAVLTIGDAAVAVPLARALVAGGVGVIEITLRTPVAIDALRAIADEVPGAVPGVGTVRSPGQAEAAIAAGARFIVSPGMTPLLVRAAEDWPVGFLPGAATASEAMALADLGYRRLKLFPAEQAGGQALLKALAAPLAELSFCPTGGIDPAKARGYLALPNVFAVGGSWVAPAELVAAGDWAGVTRLAGEAAALR